MTAPGQEPDEVMTTKPRRDKEADDRPEPNADAVRDAGMAAPSEEHGGADQAGSAAKSYDPKKIGDTHLPDDLREDEKARRNRLEDE